jgi:hypothetical protein
MRLVPRTCAGLLLAGLIGCGSSGRVAVTGKVTLDGEALPNAVVTFYPEGETGGLGGHATTGPDGTYALTSKRGDKGILPGEYKVTVSRRLRPDGSAPGPNVRAIESDASERLPDVYHNRDRSVLHATVSKDANVHDFPLQRNPKTR